MVSMVTYPVSRIVKSPLLWPLGMREQNSAGLGARGCVAGFRGRPPGVDSEWSGATASLASALTMAE